MRLQDDRVLVGQLEQTRPRLQKVRMFDYNGNIKNSRVREPNASTISAKETLVFEGIAFSTPSREVKLAYND